MTACVEKNDASSRALIFVLDDDDTIRKLLQLMLERMNYRVMGFERGEALLAACAEGFPDLVLLDIQVATGMGGLDCLRALHSKGYDRPAIALTGFAESRGGNFSAVLGKPFTISELQTTVHSVLDGENRHE